MNTIYLFDPLQRSMTTLQANLDKRTVEPTNAVPPTHAVEEFATLHTHERSGGRQEASKEYLQTRQSTVTEWCAQDIMTHPLVVASHRISCTDALRLLESHEVHNLPVVRDGQVIGLINDRQLLRAPAEEPIEGLCGPFPIAPAQTRVSSLALLFLSQNWSACLVRTGKGLSGIVTDHDLLKCLLSDSRPAAAGHDIQA